MTAKETAQRLYDELDKNLDAIYFKTHLKEERGQWIYRAWFDEAMRLIRSNTKKEEEIHEILDILFELGVLCSFHIIQFSEYYNKKFYECKANTHR